MNFLDKMKAMKAENKDAAGTPAVRPNPFAKPSTAAPVTQAVMTTLTTAEEKPAAVNPFAKKAATPVAPVTPAEEKVETTVTTEQEKSKQGIVEAVLESINEVEVEDFGDGTPVDPKLVTSEEVTGKVAAPKATRKSKKDAEKTEEEDQEPVDYDTAVSALFAVPFNQEWEDFKKIVEAELDQTRISNDMNPGTLAFTISSLDSLRQDIFQRHYDTKALIEMMGSDKPEGLIERVKRKASVGSNPDERRRNGILAAESYGEKGQTINLYEVLDQARIRFSFLDGTMNTIQYKKDALITMNGALKLELSLIR